MGEGGKLVRKAGEMVEERNEISILPGSEVKSQRISKFSLYSQPSTRASPPPCSPR